MYCYVQHTCFLIGNKVQIIKQIAVMMIVQKLIQSRITDFIDKTEFIDKN